MYVIYLDPRQRRLFDDSPEWTVVDDKGWYACITGKLSEDLGAIPLAEATGPNLFHAVKFF